MNLRSQFYKATQLYDKFMNFSEQIFGSKYRPCVLGGRHTIYGSQTII